jgi:putative spermidine/putrescine transport system substrate-binding protein
MIRTGSLFATVAVTAALIAGPAQAQMQLDMAAFGGGASKTWQDAIITPFQKETGITVRLHDMDSPEAALRAQAGRPQYHVVLVETASGSALISEKLLTKLDPADYSELAGVPKKAQLYSADNELMGISVYTIGYGIGVNTDLAKTSDFPSWNTLADPKWKGKLGITRPVYSSILDLTMMSFANGGTEEDIQPGLEKMKAFIQNASTIVSSTAQTSQVLMSGEVTAIPHFHTRIFDMRRTGQKQVDMSIPSEGTLAINYAVVVPLGIAVTPELKKFLNYATMLGPQMQAFKLAGYLPLNPKADLSGPNEGNMDVEKLRKSLRPADPRILGAKQKERVNLLEQIFAGTK